MKTKHDLAALSWRLAGYIPYQWRFERSMETGEALNAEVPGLPVRVPGSVQQALREAGLLPDWNVGLNSRECDWVENRHWVFETAIPDEWVKPGVPVRLRCDGLDGPGWIMVNGKEAGSFASTFVPHRFDLGPHLRETNNRLQVVFGFPPRWLGQFGYTSQMTEWKARFNYTWDWVPRLVQIGIWDRITLEVVEGPEIHALRCAADGRTLRVWGQADGPVELSLCDGGRVLRTQTADGAALIAGVVWDDLPVESWWPNGHGARPLYTLRARLLGPGGRVEDEVRRRVGFKQVRWEPCEGAPEGADPWICVVNGKRIFLQGVNWTPIRPCFADVTAGEYQQRIATYVDLGCNVLRVWGGAVLEREEFYDRCDEAGLLVWQEFPLSSSGADNWPPEDPRAIADQAAAAASYIERRQHHASLLLWCGGNELQGTIDGGKVGCGKPVDLSHPLIGRFGEVVQAMDPGRRFLPTSSSGPRFYAVAADFGKGLHWDVHGPWNVDTEEYWAGDDSLFRSEVGAPGASPADLIRYTAGEMPMLPATRDNALWRRMPWWIDWPQLCQEHGREPGDLDEYVAWSQARQVTGLTRAVGRCKARFPRCGGVILWMGHDCFPCTANTSILDLHGRPKPAALAVGAVFRKTEQKETKNAKSSD